MNNIRGLRRERGFTLMELMIVVAIIGILAAIAVPSYRDYVIRSRVAEAVGLMQPAQTAIELHRGREGAFPTVPMGSIRYTAAAASYAGNYVSAVEWDVTNRRIVVTFRNDVEGGGNLTYEATMVGLSVCWEEGSSSTPPIDPKYWPNRQTGGGTCPP